MAILEDGFPYPGLCHSFIGGTLLWNRIKGNWKAPRRGEVASEQIEVCDVRYLIVVQVPTPLAWPNTP
jgi:hypothetical protein